MFSLRHACSTWWFRQPWADKTLVNAFSRPRFVRQNDYDVCARLLAAGSKTFNLASKLLPSRVIEGTTVLYAFCRVADDEVDANPSATKETVRSLHARLDRVYQGSPDPVPVDRALSAIVEAYALPRAPFDALLDGLAWDTEQRTYRTIADLEAYAARVAATVGVLMTYIMGARDYPTLARACDLGVAMQLTNIARDVGEDARLGRIYLPLDWLAEEGLSPTDMGPGARHSTALGRVVARLLRHADALYFRSELGIPHLPEDCRTAIFAARLIYAEIGRVIARADFDAVSSRAHVATPRKLALLARALRAKKLRATWHEEPPVAAVRFLLPAIPTRP